MTDDPRARRAAGVATVSAALAVACAALVTVAVLVVSPFGLLVVVLFYGAVFVPMLAGVVLATHSVRRARRDGEVDGRLAIAMAMLAPGLLFAAYLGSAEVSAGDGHVLGWVVLAGGLAGATFATSAVTAWLAGRRLSGA